MGDSHIGDKRLGAGAVDDGLEFSDVTDVSDFDDVGPGFGGDACGDAVGVGVCVRPRARGDRFQPLGMPTDVRLQDVLVNAKVPRSLRDGLPLVVGDRGIAWVPGVRIAEWAKVAPETRRVVTFEARSLVGGLGL